jgi:Type IX secretion system protein PorV
MKIRYLLPFLISAACVASSFAQVNVSKTGTTAATFLEIGIGANANGMGDAYVTRASDATSIYWNPAGIALLENNDVVAVHSIWIASTNLDWAGLVLPLGDFGNLGFSFTDLSMPDEKVRTVVQPEGTGEYFSAGDLALGVSYARKLTDRFSIGFTGKYIQESIWHMSSSAFALDIGTLFRTDLLGGMMIGASISNFGTPMQLSGIDTRTFAQVDPTVYGSNDQIPYNIALDSWGLPLLFRIGVSTNAIKTDNYRWTIALDALHPNDNYETLNVGTEFAYKESLFLRVGFQSLYFVDPNTGTADKSFFRQPLYTGQGGLSFGVGVNSQMLFSTDMIEFDYAYRDFGLLNAVQLFSVGIEF